MEYKTITFIIICIMIIGTIILVCSWQGRSPDLTREEASKKLQAFLSANPSISMTDRFKADQPELAEGGQIAESISRGSVRRKVLAGQLSDIKAASRYWVFSWTSPGVIDESYHFYIDAHDGAMILAFYLQSPD